MVGAFVAFRGIFRDQPEIEPEPVDYLGPVAGAQGAGEVLVYPRELPEGWIATSVDYEPGDPPGWGIGFLTDDEKYVGLRQADEDAEDMVSRHVDEAATDEGTTSSWRARSPPPGRPGRTTAATSATPASRPSLDGATLLVYGSASAEDQAELIAQLTTEPVE